MGKVEDISEDRLNLEAGTFQKAAGLLPGRHRRSDPENFGKPGEHLIMNSRPHAAAPAANRNEGLQDFDDLIFGAVVAIPHAADRETAGGLESFDAV